MTRELTRQQPVGSLKHKASHLVILWRVASADAARLLRAEDAVLAVLRRVATHARRAAGAVLGVLARGTVLLLIPGEGGRLSASDTDAHTGAVPMPMRDKRTPRTHPSQRKGKRHGEENEKHVK